MLRKAVCLAAVTLHISLQGAQVDQNEKISELGLHLDVLQIPTGGLAQIPEIRILDENESTLLKDFIFAARRSQNRLIRGMKSPHNRIGPDLTPRTSIPNVEIGKYLRGEISEDGADSGGFVTKETGLWIHSFDEREDGAWTVEQVRNLFPNASTEYIVLYSVCISLDLGFKVIGRERYHTRKVVVAHKSGAFEMSQFVFSYLGP
jgi:hypothetical protein